MTEALGLLVEAEDWPHGLRCAECERLLDEGDRYSERLDSLTDDGIPLVVIVCVGCAFSQTQNTNSSPESE